MKCGKKWQDILQNVKYFMLKYFFLCIFRDAGYRCDVQQPQPHHLPRMHGSVAPTPVSLLTYFFWLFKQITATSLNRLNQN